MFGLYRRYGSVQPVILKRCEPTSKLLLLPSKVKFFCVLFRHSIQLA